MEQHGRYRLVRKLGQGGMAEVFEAVAVGADGFERRVALKRILPGHADDPSICRMFVDEARIASRLHDRNLVPVLDYGLADGVPFQVIELVEGVDVSRLTEMARAAGEPLPVDVALHLCTEVASGLDHAHRACDDRGRPLGIVHRDVSPGNILVSWSGDVKLGDFGVAFARERAERTESGVAKGKLLYMAPEQMTASGVDARTDVFALGCVLHTLVAGGSPLSRDGAVRAVLAGEDLPLDAALPDDVRAIVARATRAARAERWASAAAMAAETSAALALRSRGDPRALLRRFLDRHRPAPPARAGRGRLDDLLDVELVLAGARDEVRRFEATGTVGTTPARHPIASRHPGGAEREAPRGRRAVALAVVGALALALVVGVVRDVDGPVPPAPVVGRALPSVPRPATREQPVGTGVSSVASVPQAPVAAQSRPTRPLPEGQAKRGRRVPSSVVEPAGPGEAVPVRGFLRIGGAAAQNAQILVDGRPAGYAPARISLPVGSHQIELRRSGQTLASRTVTIAPEDTDRSPAGWMLP